MVRSPNDLKLRPATIRDVATAAGVSEMTVSRVLNKPETVRQETRDRVTEAIHALGYIPNAMARGMRTSSTSTIGFILPDITNSTNATIAQHAEMVFSRHNYRMLLLSTGYNADIEADFLSRSPGNIVDGIIMALSDETNPRIQDLLASMTVPYIVLDRDLPFASDSIKSDHESAIRDALRHLYQMGHRRIGLVISPRNIRPGRARLDAFTAFMAEHDLDGDQFIRCVPQTVEDGRDATTALLNEYPRPSAIIVGSNQQTIGAIQAIKSARLSIPDDISLIGADEKVVTDLLTPPLSVIWRDMAEVGRTAAKLLLARLSGDTTPPRGILVNSELIIRASSGPPPAEN